MRRSQSPDSALHLDGDETYDSSQEIYGYTGYSNFNSQNQSYQDSRKSQLNGNCKKGSKAHRSSAALSVATVSPRPHEQWC